MRLRGILEESEGSFRQLEEAFGGRGGEGGGESPRNLPRISRALFKLFAGTLAGIYEILFKSSKSKAFITCRDVVEKSPLITDSFAVISWYNG